MFSSTKYVCLYVIFGLIHLKSCTTEPISPPMLVLYSPGDIEYTDVLVRQVHDNLTLVCELRGDNTARSYVWNYVPDNMTSGERPSPFTIEPAASLSSSKLLKTDLQVSDSGQYMCSAPPFSVTKYIVVQTKGVTNCARSAFRCGTRCVLPVYVCDGRTDCAHAEDEAEWMCGPMVCAHTDKLNCSGGRCISSNACCRRASPLCQQPTCCLEHSRISLVDGFVDPEYPPLYEDRRAPDDYGFIQSTIYTVTACALIFMIAVVLLVSAICKMQMKRAALRGYTHADRAAAHHYSAHYHQAQRFPPCYEASRLLEERGVDSLGIGTEQSLPSPCETEASSPSRGLSRLSHIFSTRYRQVPTQPAEVELQQLPYTNSADTDTGTDPLNCSQLTARRDRLTLQVGRFQLTIPRLNRAMPRPATPTVAELDLGTLDFVRLGSNDTYTLNGRTIRLLGAEFECPVPGGNRPPSYMEAVRYKLYGPPPEYLSREGLNRRSADQVDEEATSNVEMPPCYDELSANITSDNNGSNNATATANNVVENNVVANNGFENNGNANNGTVNRVIVENNVFENNGNASNGFENNGNGNRVIDENNAVANNNVSIENNVFSNVSPNNNVCVENNVTSNNNVTQITIEHNNFDKNGVTQGTSVNTNTNNITNSNLNINNGNIETLSSIIDNLPAIDSDVNANDPISRDGTNAMNSNNVMNNVNVLSSGFGNGNGIE